MKYIIILGLLLVTVYSCTESFNADLVDQNGNRLVVEGVFTNQHKIHEITLSRTGKYYLNGETDRVLGATVSITDNDTVINLHDNNDDGVYETERELAGKDNHTYTLNITLANGEQYSATETILPINPIDSINYIYDKSENPFDDKKYYHIKIYVQESPIPNQFYQWDLLVDDTCITDTLRLKRVESDDLLNGNYVSGWTVYEIDSDEITEEEHVVTLQMSSLSQDMYDFHYSVLMETDYSGSMFSGNPSNVPSNISNGAFGYFRASAVSEKSIIVKRHEDDE